MKPVRRSGKSGSKLLAGWNSLRTMLERGNPRRFFAGRFFKGKTRVIQTAKNSPRRRQIVKRRKRVVMARKKRIAYAATSAVKLALFTAALAVLGIHVLEYMNSSPRFSIAHIAVTGNSHVTARKIITESGIVEGEKIFRINLARSAAAIREIPWIRDVRVQRMLPNEVHIEVTERKPAALVLSKDIFYIDSEAKVVTGYDSSEGIDAPIITAKALGPLKPGDTVEIEGIAEALDIIRLVDTMGVAENMRISEINIDDPANILMIAEQSGANILIGSGDLEGKLWRLARVARTINYNKRLRTANLQKMDMRFEAIVPARFGGS